MKHCKIRNPAYKSTKRYKVPCLNMQFRIVGGDGSTRPSAGFYSAGAAYHVNVRNLCRAVTRHTVETIVHNRIGVIGCAITFSRSAIYRRI